MRPTGPAGPDLLVRTPAGEYRIAPAEGVLRVGRDPLCRIVVADSRVSREHVEIAYHGGHWRLRDLGTRNGTYLDGRVTGLDVTGPVTVRLGAADGPALDLRPDTAVALPELPPAVPTAGAPREAQAAAPPNAAPPAARPTPPRATTAAPPAAAPAGPAVTPEPPPAPAAPPPVAAPPAPPAPAAAPGDADGAVLGGFPAPAAAPAPTAGPVPAGAPQLETMVTPGSVPVPFVGSGVPSATYRVAERLRIGRAPDNDIVLDDLQVSRRHAHLLRTPEGLRLVDLSTRNGSFVDGRRVSSVALADGDVLSFGRHRLVVDGSRLVEYVDTGRVSLSANGLTVTVKGGRRLLDDVAFDVPECGLLAVVGPSGAGKSTLLGALTGYRPAQQGTVTYDGRDLYADYDELRHRIGLVPQDDILHAQLTVRRALRYAARLRFATDVTAEERDRRIDEVIAQLGLTAQADQRIDTLSGGQRKRTSVALELLTEPSLLFLDEPTSGLDPALDRDVMTTLRGLADKGRTVVVVTHSPLHLAACDRVLVLGRGGVVTFFGPPADLLPYFGADEYADVFQRVAEDPATWAARHRARVGHRAPARPAGAAAPAGPSAVPPKQPRLRQLAVLTRRMLAVTLADRMYAALLLGLPLGLALLLHVIPGNDGLSKPDGPLGRSAEAAQLLVVLTVGAIFFGLAGGIRELVRERAIYRRERAVGLSPGAYLGSKMLVFGLINAVQATVFVLLGLLGRPGPAEALVLGRPMLELIAVVWLTALVATVTGLLVSAYVATGEQTMPVLVGLVMAQLVLCGGLFAVVGRTGIEQASWLAPSRWGYAAAAATVDLRAIMLDAPHDALWDHRSGAWLWAAGVLAAQGLVLLVATRVALRRHEPGR
ncbi:FHA domain-containing protein [Actinocatenispora rupis]|uniref:FHA modulated ABC efflux pump with fused ATPase and integral membrane subunits n=1 Tax=Actinocatenispora rupis TaxID=519421 RepID=A0A8J3J8N4_9ACTN|nr:FHA domain-containing protein [Actinocatenispora rupis]GID13726.1 hypothetical protein Aru02nite_46150 [Actinocatenispora rupis]